MSNAGTSRGPVLNSLRLVVGALDTNCYLAWRPDREDAVIFDPGGDADLIRAELAKRKLTPAAILITHCHCDHIGAVAELKKAYPQAPVAAPEAEAQWLPNPTRNLSYFFGDPLKAPAADRRIREGERLEYAGLRFKTIHVRGHSPGGMAYLTEDSGGGPPHLFCGDVLFRGGIGRGDLPGGEGEEVLVENIRERLFCLPNDTVVHPGHGEETTIGAEKAFNPFCGEGVDIA
jgi:glyoxylase-like metal-dependent hydrolase (beta-lactamase superfamily II)